MKKLSALFICCTVSLFSFAQTPVKKAAHGKPDAKSLLNQIIQRQVMAHKTAAKTTTVSQRLIATAEYDGPPSELSDSVQFVYTDVSRGSSFDGNWFYMLNNQGPSSYFFGDIYGYNSNNGRAFPHNQAPLVMYDSTTQWSTEGASMPLGHIASDYHIYDSHNDLLEEMYLGDPGNMIEHFLATYNSLSNITTALEIDGFQAVASSPITWDTSYLSVFGYNTANQMTFDSVCMYDVPTATFLPQTKYEYNYDGAGNMTLAKSSEWDGSAWTLSGTYAMTYNSSNQLQKYQYTTYSPSPELAIADSMGYTPGISFPVYENALQYTSGTVSDSSISILHTNSAGLPDSLFAYDYSAGEPFNLQFFGVITYNSYNNPISLMTYGDTSATSAPLFESENYYYYELYGTSGVPQAVAAVDMKIFPNPVSGTLFIKQPELMANNTVTVEITNANGASIKKETVSFSSSVQGISVDGLLPGIYIVTVRDVTGHFVHTEKILKI